MQLEYFNFCKNLLDGNHVLIAGATGSGKSVLLNDILWSALAFEPGEYSFCFVDPKMVELYPYKEISHCLAYADTEESTLSILHRAIDTMDIRYSEMRQKGLKLYDGGYIYIVIDELADLLTSKEHSKEYMRCLQKIAQLGRACKVVLLMCSQAPSRRILKAELLLNINTRIALHCNDRIESTQIINSSGAELLPPHGIVIVKTVDGIHFQEVPMLSEDQISERISVWTKHKKKRLLHIV